MTHLYLIRHAESVSAVRDMVGDYELSPLGIRQAERLRDRLVGTDEIEADVLISSTLTRARQTTEIIAPALGLPILFDDEVQELHEGKAAGMTIKDFIARFGEVDFKQKPFRRVAPGGENWGEFLLRVGTALDRITREHEGKTIVIVCHGGIIDGSFLYFFGLSTLQVPQIYFYTHNTSITHWEKDIFRRSQSVPRWRLVKYNDDMHLRDIDSPVRIPWQEIAAKPTVGADQPTTPLETEKQI